MGIRLVDLTKDRRTLTVPIAVGEDDAGEPTTEPLVLVYRPSAYTANTEREMNVLRESDWKSALGLSFVETLVVSWDLEDDGKPFPIEKERLAELPSNFISAVISGIADDMGKALAR